MLQVRTLDLIHLFPGPQSSLISSLGLSFQLCQRRAGELAEHKAPSHSSNPFRN